MKAKLQQVSQIINPFSGINFIISEFNKLGIPKLIDKHLGHRVKQATYKYSDVILTWIYSNLCGAERLEDTIQLKEYFLNIPKFKFCSSDRIAGIFKSLSSFNLKFPYKNEAQKIEYHEFNINTSLNKLMIETALHTKVIKPNVGYTLDYDNYIVETEKYDSKKTYQETWGYNPGVAFIGKIPVYVEGRNGNSPALFYLENTVMRTLKMLKNYNITISRFRSDAAACQKKVILALDEMGIEFFIRAIKNKEMQKSVKTVKWNTIEKNGYTYWIGSFEYKPFNQPNTYRCVVSKNISFQNTHENYDNNSYRVIFTNNWKMSPEEVFHFYNARGSMEKNFDTLGNDFNWKRVPFSFLNYNTSFMIIGGITNILYEYIIRKYSHNLHFVNRKQRLKSFIFSFITVSGHWVITTTGYQLQIYTTTRDYNNLWLDGCFESG